MSWNCFLSSLLFGFFVIQMRQINGQEFKQWINHQDCIKTFKRGTEEHKELTAEKNEFPFMISLQTRNGYHFCSGTLINNAFILTAAHCIESFKAKYGKPSDMIAVMGTNNRRERQDSDKYGPDRPQTVFNVSQWIVNGCYHKKVDISGDIALAKLANELSEETLGKDHIIPVCLAPPDSKPIGKDATVVGWGQWTQDFDSDEKDTSKDKDLKKSYPELVHEQYCELHTYFRTLGLDGTINYGNKLCAKSKLNTICAGDSGGPLLQLVDTGKTHIWYQIGIASTPSVGLTSKMCYKSSPVLYLQTSSYLNWIMTNTEKGRDDKRIDITTECDKL